MCALICTHSKKHVTLSCSGGTKPYRWYAKFRCDYKMRIDVTFRVRMDDGGTLSLSFNSLQGAGCCSPEAVAFHGVRIQSVVARTLRWREPEQLWRWDDDGSRSPDYES